MRNPPWARDELIVALDFYLSYTPSIPSQNSQEIKNLSTFLNQLGRQLQGEVSETFRNPNGVYMKAMNFRRLDPRYSGQGLRRGGKDEEIVWNLYSSDTTKLRKIVDGIRSLVLSTDPFPISTQLISTDEEEAEEGKILTGVHKYRERDSKLVGRKKASVLKRSGHLSCEVCEFDFLVRYGGHGEGYIECHHVKPISELREGEKTKLSDLALVCSNCHRMIHRKRPWLSIDELRRTLISD